MKSHLVIAGDDENGDDDENDDTMIMMIMMMLRRTAVFISRVLRILGLVLTSLFGATVILRTWLYFSSVFVVFLFFEHGRASGLIDCIWINLQPFMFENYIFQILLEIKSIMNVKI